MKIEIGLNLMLIVIISIFLYVFMETRVFGVLWLLAFLLAGMSVNDKDEDDET